MTDKEGATMMGKKFSKGRFKNETRGHTRSSFFSSFCFQQLWLVVCLVWLVWLWCVWFGRLSRVLFRRLCCCGCFPSRVEGCVREREREDGFFLIARGGCVFFSTRSYCSRWACVNNNKNEINSF